MQMRSSYEEHIVEYRYLGKSGLYASRICVGGVQLGSEGVSQSQVDSIIGVMFDADTALISDMKQWKVSIL
ncbi:MAG: hypothetical protein ACI8V2_003709 [Candidatus Latescibacterota bacterium]|jgi:hypothetical protein